MYPPGENHDYDFHCVHCGHGDYFEVGPGFSCHNCGKWPDAKESDTSGAVEPLGKDKKILGLSANIFILDDFEFEFDEDDDFEEMW